MTALSRRNSIAKIHDNCANLLRRWDEAPKPSVLTTARSPWTLRFRRRSRIAALRCKKWGMTKRPGSATIARWRSILGSSKRSSTGPFSSIGSAAHSTRSPRSIGRFRSNSKSAHGYLSRGRLLRRLGRTERALADFTRAASADPENAIAHALLGEQLVALGRPEEALKSFENAVEADPGLAEAHDRLGTALVDIGRIDEARVAYERAVALSPEKPGFYHNLTAVAELSSDNPEFLPMTRLARDSGSLAADESDPPALRACQDV